MLRDCPLWACSLAWLWLGGERNTIATASWWIKAIIGKRKSLRLHTHAHTYMHTHLIKRKRKPEDNFYFPFVCDSVTIYVTVPHIQTQTHTQSHCHSFGYTVGIKHGRFSLAEFSPCPSIICVNQHRVEPLHTHYSLINPLIIRKLCLIVTEQYECVCVWRGLSSCAYHVFVYKAVQIGFFV